LESVEDVVQDFRVAELLADLVLEEGDALVLDFLSKTTLHAGDFTPVSDGSVRLHPQLARVVVASCRVKQPLLDAHARRIRDLLMADSPVARPA
jgi:hypothetical protein